MTLYAHKLKLVMYQMNDLDCLICTTDNWYGQEVQEKHIFVHALYKTKQEHYLGDVWRNHRLSMSRESNLHRVGHARVVS